jgi:hypothetical protein
MKGVLDNLRPEPGPKMWQKFETEGIVHKEFAPPGQTVSGIFHCDVLRWMSENIRRKPPDKWRSNSWALHHDNTPAHASLVVQQFLASTNTTVFPHPPYSSDLAPCDFLLYSKMKLILKGRLLTALKWSRPNRRSWRRRWREMTSRSASDRGNPTGIAVSMPKRTTSKGMGANWSFGKWLSYGRGIPGTFG